MKQRDRNHDPEPLDDTLQVFVLAAPGELIAGRQLNLLSHHALGFVHIAPHVTAGHIHVDKPGQEPFFVLDHRRAGPEPDAGQLADRHLSAARR